MGDSEAIRTRLYESYATTHLGPPDSRGMEPAFRAHVLPWLPADRGAAIADIGCGAGMLVKFLRDAGYGSVAGVDSSPEQVAWAKRSRIAGIEQGDLRDYLTAHRGRLDAIVALDVLEHFSREEALEVLDCIHAALRPGGRLILRTPNAGSPFAGRVRYWDLTHEIAFTTGSISQALRATDFDRISTHPATPPPHGPTSLVRWGLWKAMATFCWLYLAAETGVLRGHVLTQNLIAVGYRPDR